MYLLQTIKKINHCQAFVIYYHIVHNIYFIHLSIIISLPEFVGRRKKETGSSLKEQTYLSSPTIGCDMSCSSQWKCRWELCAEMSEHWWFGGREDDQLHVIVCYTVWWRFTQGYWSQWSRGYRKGKSGGKISISGSNKCISCQKDIYIRSASSRFIRLATCLLWNLCHLVNTKSVLVYNFQK